MDKQERELLVKTCDLLLALAEIQMETYRAMRALTQAVQTQFPNLEEAYRTAQTDALFATATSVKVNKMIQQIQDTVARLKMAQTE
jgi:hypothetical protein